MWVIVLFVFRRFGRGRGVLLLLGFAAVLLVPMQHVLGLVVVGWKGGLLPFALIADDMRLLTRYRQRLGQKPNLLLLIRAQVHRLQVLVVVHRVGAIGGRLVALLPLFVFTGFLLIHCRAAKRLEKAARRLLNHRGL